MIKYNVPKEWEEVRGLSKPYTDFEGDKPIYVPGLLIGWKTPDGFVSPDKLPPEMIEVTPDREMVEPAPKPRITTPQDKEIQQLKDKIVAQEKDLSEFRVATFELGKKMGEMSTEIQGYKEQLAKAKYQGNFSFSKLASVTNTIEVILELFPCPKCVASFTALRDLLVDGMEHLSPGLYAKITELKKDALDEKKQELMDKYGIQR